MEENTSEPTACVNTDKYFFDLNTLEKAYKTKITTSKTYKIYVKRFCHRLEVKLDWCLKKTAGKKTDVSRVEFVVSNKEFLFFLYTKMKL